MFTFDVDLCFNGIVIFSTNRRQQVVINGYSSDWSPVLSGVPQGYILGPLLFILYINDLPSAVCSPMKIFADDVAMYCSVQSNADCSAFQHDLDLNYCLVLQMADVFKSFQM